MAARFWVGGSGTWNNSSTANWSATSGGAPGASAPTTADTVTFDANSGTAATVTVDSTAVTSTTTVDKSDITLILSGNATLSTTGAFTLSQGTLNLNSNTLTVFRFSSSTANNRTIAFGANGKILLTGTNILAWNTTSTPSTLTVSGSRNIEMTTAATTGTRQFAGGNVGESKAWNLSVTAGTDTILIQNHINNLDLTGFAGIYANDDRTFYGNVIFVAGVTYSAGSTSTKFSATTGTQLLTTNGTTQDYPITKDGAGTLQLQDNLTMGSTRTFTLTAGTLDLNNQTLSTGIFSSSNSNTRSIAFGTGNITVTGNAATVWTTSTVTNFSYTGTPTVNFTYAGGTGTRTITTGALSEAQTININVSAGSDIVNNIASVKNLNFTGFTGTWNHNATTTAYVNVTLVSGMSNSGTGILFFGSANSAQQFTTAGLTLDFPISVGSNLSAPILQFQDALTMGATRAFTLAGGTVELKAGVTSTVGSFVATSPRPRTLRSTLAGTQATLSQASGTVDANQLTIQDINAVGGATFNAFVNQQNVDAGNNDGWDFGISPIVGSYEYTYQLRSFTQPRRF